MRSCWRGRMGHLGPVPKPQLPPHCPCLAPAPPLAAQARPLSQGPLFLKSLWCSCPGPIGGAVPAGRAQGPEVWGGHPATPQLPMQFWEGREASWAAGQERGAWNAPAWAPAALRPRWRDRGPEGWQLGCTQSPAAPSLFFPSTTKPVCAQHPP